MKELNNLAKEIVETQPFIVELLLSFKRTKEFNQSQQDKILKILISVWMYYGKPSNIKLNSKTYNERFKANISFINYWEDEVEVNKTPLLQQNIDKHSDKAVFTFITFQLTQQNKELIKLTENKKAKLVIELKSYADCFLS